MGNKSNAKSAELRAARGLLVALTAVSATVLIALQEANAQGAARAGEQVVKSVCAACHESGKGGAPRVGDRDAWIQRLKQGVNDVVSSAIRGHGGMPPRGGQANLTDGELRSAILYMFNPAGVAEKDGAAVRGAAKQATSARPWSNYVKTAAGMQIHLGFVSTESLRKYPEGSPEASMHGGVPNGSGYYHLNVSLIDSASKAAISGARVEAKVEQIGLSSKSQLLEPIQFDNVPSYGNYFKLSSRTPYRITVKVKKQGAARPVEAAFEHRVN